MVHRMVALKITCCRISFNKSGEIEKVYASYDDIVKAYDPQKLRYGWNNTLVKQ